MAVNILKDIFYGTVLHSRPAYSPVVAFHPSDLYLISLSPFYLEFWNLDTFERDLSIPDNEFPDYFESRKKKGKG